MAQSVITNCTDLINCLIDASPGGESIELSAALFDAAGELAAALQLPSLTISKLDDSPLIQPAPPCVWIIGKAILFPAASPENQFEYSVKISAQVLGSGVLLLMEAGPLDAEGWSFAKNFSEFPPYFGFANQALSWLPSFYNDIVINEPQFWIATTAQNGHPEGLSVTGSVDLTQGTLASIAKYIPNA